MNKLNKWGFLMLLVLCMSSLAIKAQKITSEQAKHLAGQFLKYHNIRSLATEVYSMKSNGVAKAFAVNISKGGFIILPADERLCPVLAYSFSGSYDQGAEEWQIFQAILLSDIAKREQLADERNWSISSSRAALMEGSKRIRDFEQWPPEGTTTTGGWLETNWGQSAPYNALCPVDLRSNKRCVTGCPATAMSMILNYNQNIRGIRFGEDDRYFNNYGVGNQYMFDDAHIEHEFPSFDELNEYLIAIEAEFAIGQEISTVSKAALNFACGLAAQQVYSADLSGTYGIDQARDAWLRFGYDTVKLVYPEDTTILDQLKRNMMDGHPAQIGLVDGPPITCGHNVVADGYNTDEFFHLNFGWNGQANAWYRMPPEAAPYNLTSIEGIVLDIAAWEVHVAVPEIEDERLNVFPVPATNRIFVQIPEQAINQEVRIYSLDGRLLLCTQNIRASGIDISKLPDGVYCLKIEGFKISKLLKVSTQ
jgi:hypothetical protein